MQIPLLVPTVACMDAIQWLGQLPPASVDLFLTDPAYESLEAHRAQGTTTRLTNDWFATFADDKYPEFFRLLYSVLKPNRHCYVFSDAPSMFVMQPAAVAAGFKFWKPIVWDKQAMGMGYHYRNQCEFILFFEKGTEGRQLRNRGISDILPCKRLGPTQRSYPTEKPVELLELLVEQSTNRGEVVADPFMGSGASLVAAAKTGRQPWGCDLAVRSYELTRKRLKGIP